jgi:hypothetical protein
MTRGKRFGIPVLGMILTAIACSTVTPSTSATQKQAAATDTPAVSPTESPTIPAEKPTATVAAEEPTGEPPAYRYDVVQVPEGNTLPVYPAAGGDDRAVGNLSANQRDVIPTGRTSTIGAMDWVEIILPGGGTGWVYRGKLTEQIDSAAFCADPGVPELFSRLLAVFEGNDSSLFGPIIGPVHGVTVTYIHAGNSRVYYPDTDTDILGSTEIMDWGFAPGSGLPVQGTFFDLVRPDLVAVLNSGYEARCDQIALGGASYEVVWPFEWQNIHFYSLYKPGSADQELDWMTWLVGVDYVDGLPYLYSLNRYTWEP